MTRINEQEAAEKIISDALNGYYGYDRSQNTEVNYQKEKEQRDTNDVRNFAKSSLFNKVRNMG